MVAARQVEEVTKALFHTILLHRTTGKVSMAVVLALIPVLIHSGPLILKRSYEMHEPCTNETEESEMSLFISCNNCSWGKKRCPY